MRLRTALTRWFLLFAVLLSACSRPTPTPTPGPSPTRPPAQPTATPLPTIPAPTPTPLPPVPPTVVAVRPERGEEQAPTAPIIVTFDQPMEPEATAKAFTIDPPVEGKVVVEQNRLVFTPLKPLARAARYKVTIGPEARSRFGLTMKAPFYFRFNTVGFLEVVGTQPTDGAQDAAVDGAVTVVFNRPVVPLVSTEQQANLPQPLTFQPPVAGKGQWLNTSVYQFKPDVAFAASTTYTVTVAAGLQDTTGGVLQEDFTFHFRTADPIVTEAVPQGPQIPPTAVITVTFSQPMDRPSTEAAFSITPAVPGTFRWNDDGRVMTFVPAERLRFNTRYQAKVAATARPASGEGTLRQEEEWTFRVVSLPEVVRTNPADGQEKADPYGGLDVYFASPIDPGTVVTESITIIPKPTSVYTYWSPYENRLFIGWYKQPATAYTVTLGTQIGDAYGNRLSRPVTVRFQTGDLPPFLQVGGSGTSGTYNAYTETVLYISHRNISRLTVGLYRLSEAAFVQLNGPDMWDAWQQYIPDEADLVRQWEFPVSGTRNQISTMSLSLRDADDNPLPPGLYFVMASAPELPVGSRGKIVSDPFLARRVLILSKLNLTFKQTMTEALVWATDLRSGQAVADLPVRLVDEKGQIAQGRTGPDGVFRASFDRREPWRPLIAFAGQGDTFAAVTNQWTAGIAPWDFNISSEMYQDRYSGYLYTERPLYRPGQTVYWKAILRADDDARYTLLPPGTPVTVTVMSDQGKEVYQEVKELSAFGSLSGQFQLAEETSLGYYSLILRLPPTERGEAAFSTGFQVAEYRKPEFELTVQADRPEYVQGEVIEATVKGDYFFGGPVKGAQVRWTVMSDDYFFTWEPPLKPGEERRYYDFSDWDYSDFRPRPLRFGELIASGTGVTDAEGRFTARILADVSKRKLSQRFTIEFSVTDVNNQEVSGRTSVVVHRGEFYIGQSPRRYVGVVGQEEAVDVVTVDTKGNLLPNVTVTIVASEREWLSVQEKADDGQFYWVSKPKDTPVVTKTITTDAQGRGVFTFTPEKGGTYAILATGRDRRGNEIRSLTFLWVSGRAEEFIPWRRENNDRINLVADKKLYQVGETAKVLVPSPYQGEVQALLTVERGHILSHQLITLKGNSETLSVPILPEYTPNVFISLVLVKGMDETNPLPSFKVGYVELPVATTQKELTVTLKPSAERVGPRQTVTYTVEVKDHTGKGVAAELSLALVDKALLSMTDVQMPTLLEHFYRRRGVGVATSAMLVVSLDRLNQQLREAEGAKGGGGGGAGAMFLVRAEFPDTAYWNPTVMTDENGQAQVSVRLPDNLTTWRMSAKAVTANTEVGEAKVDIVATQDLLVRPVAPRFLVDGDKAELGAIVHNNTDLDLEVSIGLSTKDLTLSGETVQKVSVPAHGLYKAAWTATVGQGVSQAKLLFTADGGILKDAVELTLPVYRYSTADTAATAGEVSASDPQRLEVIYLPPALDPTRGDLTVRIDPSLAASVRNGFTYLENFPYDCVEQTLSSFLPNIVTYLAVREVGGPMKTELEQKLPRLLQESLQRLYLQQNPDGGWGWWGGETSTPWLTAYVVLGLAKAQQGGFQVDKGVMERALAYLTSQLKAPADFKANFEANQQAFILYALAEAGRNELSRAVVLFDSRERLGHYGKAHLAKALGLWDPSDRKRIDTLLDDLTGKAIVSATGAHWEEKWVDYWTMNTDVRTTAIVLDTLARLRPNDALAVQAARWLMSVRNGDGYWETTQETVWSIIALTHWMVASGELKADYSWRVTLNGQTMGQGTANAESWDDPVVLKAAVAGLLRDQANGLILERLPAAEGQTGEGRFYYTAHLRTFLPVDQVKALNRGIVVSREYVLNDAPDKPITQARVGDIIRVKITIVAPNDLTYFVLEDPLPAGAEAMDTSLRTTRTLPEEEIKQVKEGQEPQEVKTWSWDAWLPSKTELRDEKVALFATYLPRGTYQYTYLMRASLPGEYMVLPTTAMEMYFPEVFGRGDGARFVISGQ